MDQNRLLGSGKESGSNMLAGFNRDDGFFFFHVAESTFLFLPGFVLNILFCIIINFTLTHAAQMVKQSPSQGHGSDSKKCVN